MSFSEILEKGRRQYIRLDSVFPVEFQLLSLDKKQILSDWLQGFTSNVSKGGICLSVNKLDFELAKLIKEQKTKLSLKINMPLTKKPVNAKTSVAWIKEIIDEPNRYLIGLSYDEISVSENNRIIRYAKAKKLFVPAVLTIIFILGLGFAINSYLNVKLIKGNKALVEQLVNILQESSIAKQRIKEISKEREDLELKIQTLQSRIQTVEEEKKELKELTEKTKLQDMRVTQRIGELTLKIEELTGTVGKLTEEKALLQEQLINLQNKEGVITEELLRLDKKKVTLEKANLDKMYQWLKIHQNPRTGLVMSFEGDRDIEAWAFTYDQALVVMIHTNFLDFNRAKKILDFFNKRAKRIDGWFLNSYYANDGAPSEYIVHSGPNLWLGMAIIQYTKKSQDSSFLVLAEEIGQKIIDLQNQDPDGGIRGGPSVTWYSTEHNVDAYAFFNMLYKVSAKPKYLKARDKALNWLIQNTYNKSDIPILRGKGDSTIATDTYAFSIAGIGPEKLEEIGMNPDRIMEFAEENCRVEVNFMRPEGQTIKIKGFDFAPQRHLARGGVVSSEWTAQMILSFKIMADFYYKKGMVAKAHTYENKANEYLGQLGNMIISSPSASGQGEACLPYATQDYVDTGHGWMSPKGSRTGSVAGTAWTLFAYYNYNPLELKESS